MARHLFNLKPTTTKKNPILIDKESIQQILCKKEHIESFPFFVRNKDKSTTYTGTLIIGTLHFLHNLSALILQDLSGILQDLLNPELVKRKASWKADHQ